MTGVGMLVFASAITPEIVNIFKAVFVHDLCRLSHDLGVGVVAITLERHMDQNNKKSPPTFLLHSLLHQHFFLLPSSSPTILHGDWPGLQNKQLLFNRVRVFRILAISVQNLFPINLAD